TGRPVHPDAGRPPGPEDFLSRGNRAAERLDRRRAGAPAGRATGQERLRPLPAPAARTGNAAVRFIDTALPGVTIIEPKVFGDDRGFFLESFHKPRFAEHGIAIDIAQSNVSR